MAKKKRKTELENFLVYGVDEDSRRVYFGTSLISSWDDDNIGGFSQCSCEFAIRAIERMAMDHPKTPIEIRMNSYGGDAYAMLALYDIIQEATCQIKFYGRGAIMSSATWIMAGCDERYLSPHTTILVHDGYEDIWGTTTNVKITAEQVNYFQDKLEQIYADNSKMPKKFWAEVSKRDLYLNAEETIFLGLADKIVQPKKRGNLRKIREAHLKQKVDKRKMNKLIDKLMDRIHASAVKKIVITEHIPEPIDETLTIEPMKKEIPDDKPENKPAGTSEGDGNA